MRPQFITTEHLASSLDNPDVVVLDCSWYLPAEKRDARAEYLAGHIPGAVFFDIDAIADTTTDLPHMLPAPDDFARMVGALGVGNASTIIVYDELGVRSSARVWWEFKVMGVRHVRVLDGGGPKWRAEGRPLEAGDPKVTKQTFTAHFDASLVASMDDVRRMLDSNSAQIVDARPAPRFRGEAPEPRPGLRGGHIPGSLNVPVTTLWNGTQLKSAAGLKTLFAEAGVDLARPIVTTCGSGITASTLALALRTAGAKDVAVYDGAWAEWGADKDAPVATGP